MLRQSAMQNAILLVCLVCTVGLCASVAMAWTHDSGEIGPSLEGSWYDVCGGGSHKATSAAYTGRYANWYPNWDFRGRFRFDTEACATNDRGKNVKYHMQRQGGSDYTVNTVTQCDKNGWYTVMGDNNWNGDSDRVYRARIDAYETAYPNCFSGYNAVQALHGRWYGEKWDYINDWVCLGGYSGTINDNATGWTESDIYLYPAVDTSHGNVFTYGGKVPGRVQTGDCNWANKLDWKGNAASYGNCDNCYSYGFAWMYSPGGAGPKFLIGADDDQKTWVNGTLISSGTNCCNRDNFETGSVSMPAGWSRILFKVRNGGGGFNGTVSLRNGGDRGWNEGSVTRYNGSYGLGYEQDDWYPRIDVATFYGSSNPQPNANFYGNNTTVTASGTASGAGPVPFWKVMHFEWGYGISGDTNYTDVTSSGTSWSHTQTGVTGHRRFHFFAVSKSKRTSFQNSGVSGGWNWADGGPANYMDVYVDNVAPVNPSLSSVVVVGPNQINLSWSIPNDQGVGIGAGSTEAADEASNSSGNYYRRGDVGVNVRRNGVSVYGWGTGTSLNDTGLDSNTSYTYDIAARDNTGEARGAWHNTTSYIAAAPVVTLAEAPAAGVNLTAPASGKYKRSGWPGFTSSSFGTGNHKVSKFMYKWSTNPSDSITEGQGDNWSAGTLTATPASDGTYYLYIRSYNSANVGNGSTRLGPYTFDDTPPTTPTITGVVVNELDATVTFGGSSDANSFHYEVKLDTGSYVTATSPKTYTGLSGGSHTVYVKAVDELGNESGEVSQDFMIDGIPPTVSNITVTAENVGDPPANNCLQGKLWVDAEVTDTGGSGLASVQIKLDDGDYVTMPNKQGGDPEDYEVEYTIDASWTNGSHSVTIKATDNAGNSTTTDPIEFNVNKNTVSGFVGLQNFTWVLKNRDVAFGLNGSTLRIVTLSFVNGIAAYSLTDVPDLTSISAKTAWSLRRLITGLSAPDGQYEADFTGSSTVLGGDLNGDNVVNALDYSILRGAWGTGSAGDINGDGYTDNADYLIQKSNWYRKGDPQ